MSRTLVGFRVLAYVFGFVLGLSRSGGSASAAPGDTPVVTPPATPPAALPPAPAISRGVGKARFARILPTLRIVGDTKGDADFALGLDIAMGVSRNWDVKLTPEVTAKTSTGIAEVFRRDDDETTPAAPSSFGGGLTLWFIRLPREVAAEEYYGGSGYQLFLERRSEAFMLCDKRCPAGDKSASCASFDRVEFDKAKAVNPAFIDVHESKLCLAGVQYLSSLQRERDGMHPRLLISVAGAGDALTSKYVGANDGVLRSRTFGGYKAGSAVAVLAGAREGKEASHQMTLEFFAGTSGAPKPSTSAIEWCTPGPTVTGENVLGDSRRCESSVFGAPKAAYTSTTGIYGGYLYEGKIDWRAAVGGTFTSVRKGNKQIYAVGMELPVYIDFLSASKRVDNAKIAYRGVAIVRPRVEATFTPDEESVGPHWTALLRIELRGVRELFAGALTYF